MRRGWVDENREPLLAGLAVLAALAGAVALVIHLTNYRVERDVQITARWWETYAAYTYTTTTLVPVTDCRDVCTGSGSDRRCTQSCTTRLESRTDTMTRCRNTATGTDWPPVAPGLPCDARPGDRYVATQAARLAFYVAGDPDHGYTRDFPPALWERFAPGARRRIEQDAFGRILRLAEE